MPREDDFDPLEDDEEGESDDGPAPMPAHDEDRGALIPAPVLHLTPIDDAADVLRAELDDLGAAPIDSMLLAGLPPRLAFELEAIILCERDGVRWIATSGAPEWVRPTLESWFGAPVVLLRAAEDEIADALEYYYAARGLL